MIGAVPSSPLFSPTTVPARAASPPAAPAEASADEVRISGDQPYYDSARDRRDVAAYYATIDQSQDPQAMFGSLHELVSSTHTQKLGYHPDTNLYPWVDLRPNLRLNSLYSDQSRPLDDPVRSTSLKDFRESSHLSRKELKRLKGDAQRLHLASLQKQADQWAKALSSGGLDAVSIAQKIAVIETQTYFNCEHVVPQKWFDGAAPMVGDLHHLFACRSDANNARGSRLFAEVPDHGGRNTEGWAPPGENLFEPASGKGAIARATLYFLLRYPGKIGDEPGEYSDQDVDRMLRWHHQDPVSLHERHRNQAIADLQGNRNPLIDHPEWADRIDFSQGLGTPRKKPRQLQPTPFPRQHFEHRGRV